MNPGSFASLEKGTKSWKGFGGMVERKCVMEEEARIGMKGHAQYLKTDRGSPSSHAVSPLNDRDRRTWREMAGESPHAFPAVGSCDLWNSRPLLPKMPDVMLTKWGT